MDPQAFRAPIEGKSILSPQGIQTLISCPSIPFLPQFNNGNHVVINTGGELNSSIEYVAPVA
eukprot:4385048-Karenia_brevis.AAC.1